MMSSVKLMCPSLIRPNSRILGCKSDMRKETGTENQGQLNGKGQGPVRQRLGSRREALAVREGTLHAGISGYEGGYGNSRWGKIAQVMTVGLVEPILLPMRARLA